MCIQDLAVSFGRTCDRGGGITGRLRALFHVERQMDVGCPSRDMPPTNIKSYIIDDVNVTEHKLIVVHCIHMDVILNDWIPTL